MKLSQMKTIDQVVEQDRRDDPEYRAEWDRTAFARAIAISVVKYRTDHGLSQRDLARFTGLTQPAIARLEIGENAPSLATLAKLTSKTGMTIKLSLAEGAVEVARVAGRPRKVITSPVANERKKAHVKL